MNDVVKTKSKAYFILILILQSFLIYQIFHTGSILAKNLYNLSKLNERTQIKIEKIFWENPEIYALLKEENSSKKRVSVEKVNYLKARSLTEFECIQKHLEGMVFLGYANKKDPGIIKIDKKIEFQTLIRFILFVCFYTLLEITVFSKSPLNLLNFFFNIFSKKNKIPFKKLFAKTF